MRAYPSVRRLLGPAIVLPGQYDERARCPQAAGERALRLAVLEDAIRCLGSVPAGARGRGRHLARRAEAWITSRDRTWPFSFDNVCEALDLDPGALRAGLLAAAQRADARDYRLRLRMHVRLPPKRLAPPRKRRRPSR